MKLFWQHYKKGLIGGALFGTFGLWFLAIASLAVPYVEYIAIPFLLPGRVLAAVLSGGQQMGTTLVLFLYLCMAVFYALVGALIQWGFWRKKDVKIDQKK